MWRPGSGGPGVAAREWRPGGWPGSGGGCGGPGDVAARGWRPGGCGGPGVAARGMWRPGGCGGPGVAVRGSGLRRPLTAGVRGGPVVAGRGGQLAPGPVEWVAGARSRLLRPDGEELVGDVGVVPGEADNVLDLLAGDEDEYRRGPGFRAVSSSVWTTRRTGCSWSSAVVAGWCRAGEAGSSGRDLRVVLSAGQFLSWPLTDRFLAVTDRPRSEGIDHRLAAADGDRCLPGRRAGHASTNGERTENARRTHGERTENARAAGSRPRRTRWWSSREVSVAAGEPGARDASCWAVGLLWGGGQVGGGVPGSGLMGGDGGSSSGR